MFDKILLAVDGSKDSQRAIPVARGLADKSHGEIVVFEAHERPPARGTAMELEANYDAMATAEASAKQLEGRGVTARPEVRSVNFGHAARAISEAAQQTGTQVIVMGSRGLSDVAGLFLGSVTHKVLHLAHCPVLVVR